MQSFAKSSASDFATKRGTLTQPPATSTASAPKQIFDPRLGVHPDLANRRCWHGRRREADASRRQPVRSRRSSRRRCRRPACAGARRKAVVPSPACNRSSLNVVDHTAGASSRTPAQPACPVFTASQVRAWQHRAEPAGRGDRAPAPGAALVAPMRCSLTKELRSGHAQRVGLPRRWSDVSRWLATAA